MSGFTAGRSAGHRCLICRRKKSDGDSLRVHKFPRNVLRCRKWVKSLNIPFLNHLSPQELNSKYVICSDHFEENQYYLSGRLLHSAFPVKNLTLLQKEERGKHNIDADEVTNLCDKDLTLLQEEMGKHNIDADEVTNLCDKDLTLLQKEERRKHNIDADEVTNLYDKEWPSLEETPGFYDSKIESIDEVRVGPSFSKRHVGPPNSSVNIHCHDEGSDDSSFDYIDSFHRNPDEVSDSEDNSPTVSTLDCIVSNPSARFLSKDGSIFRSLEKKTSMRAKHLDASYFENHLNWIIQHNTEAPQTAPTNRRKKIIARKSSRQALSQPSHGALIFKKYLIGYSGHWNTNGFSILEEKAQSLNTEDKLCGIVFHCFELTGVRKASVQQKRKSLSKDRDAVMKLEMQSTFHGLVIMVKGLQTKWKYILKYDVFANLRRVEDIKEMLKSCIVMLQDISYEVKFMVCNRNPLNELLKNMFGSSTYSKPYFTVGGKKIYFCFDPYSLLQNTMNEFIEADVYVGNNVATWKHVQSFLQKDSEENNKLAPNLSLLDGVPVLCEGLSGSKNNVATEVFSSAVSTGIYMYATSGLLPEEAIHTSKFVHMINKLMNCFLNPKTYYYNNVSKCKPSSSERMDYLLEIESVLMTWKTAKVNRKGCRTSITRQYFNKRRKTAKLDNKGEINPVTKQYFNKKRKTAKLDNKGERNPVTKQYFNKKRKTAKVDNKGERNPVTKQYFIKKRKTDMKGDCIREDKKSVDMDSNFSKEINPIVLIDNFILHWLNNIGALQQMWKELHDKLEIKQLSSQNISQNCYADVMAEMKRLGRNTSSPNVSDFKIAIQSLLKPSSRHASYLPTL